MSFPKTRLRRLRYNPILRDLVKETKISLDDLIYPMFVCTGRNIRNEISSMPGQYQLSIDNFITECEIVISKGINSILIFGIPENKDENGEIACQENSIVQKAIKEIRKKNLNLLVIADVCNCEYTNHGHCGTIVDGDVENDLTIKILASQAVSLAKAGADIIAPSDMMDGRVGMIRTALDNSGFEKIPILSYAIKYSSAFYGPFRDAADSSPSFGDRKTYQMDFANSREAFREVEQDLNEGADMIMVKPALSYLDIIYKIKEYTNVPVVAYSVSGEYSMIKAASQNNWIKEMDIVMEITTSIKRAGADIIITYHALDIADRLNNK
jgi:porphobilinogen synthase